MMSAKMGRPKAENPKDVDLKVRIDRETNAALESYIEEEEITKAEAVRRGIKLLLQKK